MFEKEADKYVKVFTDRSYIWSNDKLMQLQLRETYKDGAEYGYKKAMEEWKKCFLSCSSPYCSNNFPTIKSNGVLGCMEKIEK